MTFDKTMAERYPVANIYPSPYDPRDYVFVPAFRQEELDDFIDLRPDVFEVEDQLNVGACVTNAALGGPESICMQNGVPEDFSRMALYVMTKEYEGRLQEDGLYARNVYEVMRKHGVCLESDYPYRPSVQYTKAPEHIYQLCEERKLDRYEAIVRSKVAEGSREEKVYRIHAALQERLTVDIAMGVTSSLYDLTGPWYDHRYELMNANNAIGGHMMRIVGIDYDRKMFIVLNSWGKDWGDNGYCGLPFRIVDEPFFECYVVRSFMGMGIKEQPGIKMTFKNKYRLEARIVPEPHEVGERFNIWMGAVLPDGTKLLREPISHEDLTNKATDFSGGKDVWVLPEASSGPVVSDYYFYDSNWMRVIVWKDLTTVAGAEIYVGYGKSTLENAALGLDGNIALIGTV